MNMWERFEHLDPRLIYGLLLLVIAVPLLRPMGLPLSVLQETRDTYNAIEAIPSGTAVLLSFDYSAGAVPELDPQAKALLYHFLSKNMKIVAVTSVVDGPVFADYNMAEIYGKAGKTYGTDYVNLGFFAGGEAGLAALAEDIRGVYKTDWAGKAIDTFPIMANIHTIKDFSLAFSLNVGPTQGAGTPTWVRQVNTAYGLPVGLGVVTVMAPATTPYLQAKQIIGLLAGLRAAAEYELLVERPGKAVAGMDAQSMAHVLIIAVILLGNIGFFVTKGRRTGSASTGGVAR